MKNFSRAAHLVTRYPLTLTVAVLLSLLGAALCAANIGAIYPILEVTLQGRSLNDWVDGEIATAEQESTELQGRIAALQDRLSSAPQQDHSAIEARIEDHHAELRTRQRTLSTSRWTRRYLRRFVPDDPFQNVVLFVLLLLVATAAKGACSLCNAVLVGRLVERSAMALREQFFSLVLRMDPHTFRQRGTSNLLSHMEGEINAISAGLHSLFGVVREPLNMAACMVGAALISPRLLLFTFALAPLAGFVIHSLAKRIRGESTRAMQEDVHLNRIAFESFNGLETVQAYTMEHREQERFTEASQRRTIKALRINFLRSLAKPVTELLSFCAIAVVILVGAYLVLNRETHIFGVQICDRPLSLATLLIYYGLLLGMTEPARKLSEIYSGIQVGCAAANRLYAILDVQPSIVEPACPTPLKQPHRELVFDDVHFAYTADHPVLKGIDLHIRFGETIAIVGPNGCGKSTLVNLIPRFWDPQQGAIRLDGVDLREASLEELRRRIGLVSQQVVPFDDTVFHNILCGRPTAAVEEVIQAAQRARAHEFIENDLKDGYQSIVGQNGQALSGGQRQRIALARAILRDPQIFILDEATSQVDLQSEHLIHQAIKEFIRDRTTIIVTHRPSTLTLADRILVMEAGAIRDAGKHDELLHRCELYRRLQNDQFRKSA